MAKPSKPAPALVLVAHGSPDPDWRRPLEQLHLQLAARHAGPVRLAYLAHAPSIEDAIAELADEARASARPVVVVAALLSPGGRHVKRDIPEAFAAAAARFPELTLELRSGALGDDAGVIEALAEATLTRLATR